MLIQTITQIIQRKAVNQKRNYSYVYYLLGSFFMHRNVTLIYQAVHLFQNAQEYKEKFLPISYYHCVKVLVYSRWSDTLTYYLWIYEQISSYGTRSHASYCSKFARWCNIRKQQFSGYLFSQEWVSKTNTRWAKPSQMRS